MDQLWRGFTPANGDSHEMENWAIPLDLVQESNEIVIQPSPPGINPDDINLSIKNDVLTSPNHTSRESERREDKYPMRERHTGSFHRSLRLPDTLDMDKAHPATTTGC